MCPCLLRKQCINSCIISVLVTVLMVVQAQNIEFSEWKPIHWYVTGNITIGTAFSKLDDYRRNVPASSRGFKWGYNHQDGNYKTEDRSVDREEEVLPEGSDWAKTSRSIADESLVDTAQTIWTAVENSGVSMKAESKEEEGQSRKKKKKLLKKFALPLLVLYKIKFLMLIPVLVASMVLLSGSSGLAGFFFALLAAMMAYGKEH